jgi:hypothetical protein
MSATRALMTRGARRVVTSRGRAVRECERARHVTAAPSLSLASAAGAGRASRSRLRRRPPRRRSRHRRGAHAVRSGEPPSRGADGSHSERPTTAKGVTLARAVPTIACEGGPASVVRAILPPGAPRALIDARGGMGFPHWGFLSGGGASEGGVQGGKPRRGRHGTPFAHHS